MSSAGSFDILPLSASHNRTAFDCGVDNMNRYLREQARQDSDKGLSRTFVCRATDAPETIIGYYTRRQHYSILTNYRRKNDFPLPRPRGSIGTPRCRCSLSRTKIW